MKMESRHWDIDFIKEFIYINYYRDIGNMCEVQP